VARYVVRFAFMSKSNLVRCELDPDHDWFPRAIDVGKSGDALRIRVTKFGEVGGAVLPHRGRSDREGVARRRTQAPSRCAIVGDQSTPCPRSLQALGSPPWDGGP
jgi:hypothetical protein